MRNSEFGIILNREFVRSIWECFALSTAVRGYEINKNLFSNDFCSLKTGLLDLSIMSVNLNDSLNINNSEFRIQNSEFK